MKLDGSASKAHDLPKGCQELFSLTLAERCCAWVLLSHVHSHQEVFHALPNTMVTEPNCNILRSDEARIHRNAAKELQHPFWHSSTPGYGERTSSDLHTKCRTTLWSVGHQIHERHVPSFLHSLHQLSILSKKHINTFFCFCTYCSKPIKLFSPTIESSFIARVSATYSISFTVRCFSSL